MINITKKEAFMMRKNGYEEFVLKSHSKHPKYYLVEETEDIWRWNKGLKRRELVRLSAINALEKYRKERIVKVVER